MRRTAITLAAALLATMLPCLTACGQKTVDNKKEPQNVTTIQHLTTQEFKEKVFNYEESETFKYLGDQPAIVDFYATWCGPCKALAPVLEELAKDYDGKLTIYKVDVDKNKELSSLFGIRSVPTLLFIDSKGQPSMAPGAPTKAQLKEIIEELVRETED